MKIRTISAVLCASFVSLTLSSCASIVDGTHQSISVETPSMKGATCTLSNDKGKWFINQTPGSVTVHQSFKDMLIQCEKKGFKPVTTTVESKTKPMMFGNILFGGILGGAIDAIDGAGYAYPQTITVAMPARK